MGPLGLMYMSTSRGLWWVVGLRSGTETMQQDGTYTRVYVYQYFKTTMQNHLGYVSLKGQCHEILDWQFFSSFKPAWATDQWL